MRISLVALTGATGFIGRHLLKELPKRGYKIRVLLRRPTMLPPEASSAVVGDLTAPRNMSNALAGVDAVIHSTGLEHGVGPSRRRLPGVRHGGDGWPRPC